MNRTEAHAHIVDNTPRDVSSRAPELTECHEDEIRTWSSAIEDTNTGDTGWATFDEHYGEVVIDWDNVGILPVAHESDWYTDGSGF